jgi:hypothetical protein
MNMAKFVYHLLKNSDQPYEIYTDLDFWDTRKLLKKIARVKRNFQGKFPGDEFPTVVIDELQSSANKGIIEYRLKKAIISPPRHSIIQSIIEHGYFEFDPQKYYPKRWSKARILHFTYHRLPLQQSVLNSPYKEPRLSWIDGKVRIEIIQRKEKYDPIILDPKDAKRRSRGPGCF